MLKLARILILSYHERMLDELQFALQMCDWNLPIKYTAAWAKYPEPIGLAEVLDAIHYHLRRYERLQELLPVGSEHARVHLEGVEGISERFPYGTEPKVGELMGFLLVDAAS